MPRLTIVSQWYPPEHAPFGRMMQELAHSLSGQGWDVTVVTGFPNHPTGVLHPGYRRKWLEETMDGSVRICRVWLSLSPRRTRIGRLATFLSFTLLASWRLIRLPRAELIFAVLQPLSVGAVLPMVARIKRSKLIFNLQDLHPEAQIRAGMVRNPTLIQFLRALERYAYKNCAALTVICERFRQHAVANGASPNRVFVVRNWIDTDRIRPQADSGTALRRELGIADEDFVVLLAGTLGYASGAAVVIEAAELLRDRRRVRFLIVGEGPMLAQLKGRAASLALESVMFLPFQDESKLLAVQNTSNLSLVTLAAQFAEVSVPSKLLAYLAAGRAVVASVPEASEVADLVRSAAAGIVVPAGNASALATAILSLALDDDQVARLSSSARRFAVEHLSLTAAMHSYQQILATICATR
jgi:colanic acid biosynthesis glycosyl transferase WcaI